MAIFNSYSMLNYQRVIHSSLMAPGETSCAAGWEAGELAQPFWCWKLGRDPSALAAWQNGFDMS